MWVTTEVNIPEHVVSAQRDGRLVVFAGAGISMGAPSNLPSFQGLAEKIASGAYVREDGEPLDRFLGRLEHEGIDVQAIARAIIADPESQPKQIHRDLLELFGAAERVRIVTTNFDTHLTSAARERFGDAVQLHYAPALPLGRDLNGIVYIHGSIDQHGPLLLTDRDFGRAYIVDWWATQMLTEMFKSYCVLFVGYSHQDVVMQYLARSLVAAERFAFTEPGQDKYWQYLGITPIAFPVRDLPNRYGALEEALQAWIALAQMGVLEHERRIQEIVAAPPPLERDRVDYMVSVLRDPVRARYFAKYARGVDWLAWVDEVGSFAPLFRHDQSGTGVAPIIAEWFAEHYSSSLPAAALELVRRHGPVLSSTMWAALARHLAVCNPRPAPEVLFVWARVLVQSMSAGWSVMFVGDILQACGPDDLETALYLLQNLTSPVLRLEREWPSEEPRPNALGVRVDSDIPAERYALDQAWSRVFLPCLPQIFERLLFVLHSQLSEAHSVFSGAGRATNNWDPMSFTRSAIEAHQQDRYPNDRDFLVDAARDTLDWCARNAPETANRIIALWSTANSPLIRRLAVRALGAKGLATADAVLEEVMRRGWLFSVPLKHEVFQLVRSVYGRARPESRQRFIQHSMEVTTREAGNRSITTTPISDYERFNVAVWLAKSAPDCPISTLHLASLRSMHPEFEPRPFPDLDHWSGDFGWVTHRSPTTAAELLESAPEAALEKWLTFAPEESFERAAPDRVGLLNDFREATKQSPSWGLGLLSALVGRGIWESDFWPAVFGGWQEASAGKDWDPLLGMVLAHPELLEHFETDIADVLEHATQDEGQRFTSRQLAMVVEIGERLLGRSRTSAGANDQRSSEWFVEAINSTGGKVALIWLRALARDTADGPAQLPPPYAERLSRMLVGPSVADTYGRVILASQLHLLYGADREWTTRWVLPLFDWDADARQAEQAWHGYLGWGQWNDALLSALTPSLRKAFSRMNHELIVVRKTFCERLAAVAAFSLATPWPGWLMDFARDSAPEDRALWAEHFARYLGQMPAEAARKQWDRWIRQYWEARNMGVPRQLSDEERTALTESAIRQPGIFDEAVALALAVPAPSKPSRMLFFQLREARLAQSHPVQVARLVRHILAAVSSLPYDCGYLESIVRDAANGGADRVDLRAICEQMARLGCMNAAALQREIGE